MAHISVDEAALRTGVPHQTLEKWGEQGLLTFHVCMPPSPLPPGLISPTKVEKLVDEEELMRVVESLGWLHLSAQGWEGTEGE